MDGGSLKFYEVLLVDTEALPVTTFVVQAEDHAWAIVEALKHIPEDLYIRKAWEHGKLDSEWVRILGNLGIDVDIFPNIP